MNLEILKDAVARWQTYEDRGITPHAGWAPFGDGLSCALGDIAFYCGFEAEGDYPEFELWEKVVQGKCDEVPAVPVDGSSLHTDMFYGIITITNDFAKRWPIAELQRLIDWEEAEEQFNISNYSQKVLNVS